MKALVPIDVRLVVDEAIDAASEADLVRLYDYLDKRCVLIEEELIQLGVWEEDDE